MPQTIWIHLSWIHWGQQFSFRRSRQEKHTNNLRNETPFYPINSQQKKPWDNWDTKIALIYFSFLWCISKNKLRCLSQGRHISNPYSVQQYSFRCLSQETQKIKLPLVGLETLWLHFLAYGWFKKKKNIKQEFFFKIINI